MASTRVQRSTRNACLTSDSAADLVCAEQRLKDFQKDEEQTTLNLSFLNLCSLPESYFATEACITRLKRLNCSHNALTELPASLAKCTYLEELDCGFNQLEFLPEGLRNCSALKMLDCRGNSLQSLPRDLIFLENIDLLQCNTNPSLAWPPQDVTKRQANETVQAHTQRIRTWMREGDTPTTKSSMKQE